jgi:hypothetical protein
VIGDDIAPCVVADLLLHFGVNRHEAYGEAVDFLGQRVHLVKGIEPAFGIMLHCQADVLQIRSVRAQNRVLISV